MRFAEVLLRLGSVLVAWMILFAYFVWIAVVEKAGCGANGADIYRLLLGMAPIAVAASFLLRLTRRFVEIHRILRWLGLPLIAMLVLVLPAIWQVFSDVNLGGGTVCPAMERSLWQIAWAPGQIVAVGICTWMMIAVWRTATTDVNDASAK